MDKGVVKKRAVDDDGTLLRTYNSNIIADTSMHEVEFKKWRC